MRAKLREEVSNQRIGFSGPSARRAEMEKPLCDDGSLFR